MPYKDPEQKLKYQRKWRIKHKKRLRKQRKKSDKKYRQTHKEERKNYRQTHKEQQKRYRKKWRLKHKGKGSTKREKEYRLEHKGQKRLQDKKYRQKHKEQIRKLKKKYRPKARAKRRKLGFIVLWKPDVIVEPMVFHHVDPEFVVQIPERIHVFVSHNVWTGKNMSTINELALEYIRNSN